MGLRDAGSAGQIQKLGKGDQQFLLVPSNRETIIFR